MGSSSKSSNQTTTTYHTQNISAPGAQDVAGRDLTINKLSKPALKLASDSVNSAMNVSEKAITNSNDLATKAMKSTNSFAQTAIQSNVNVANNSLDKITDVVDANYRQSTNQLQQLRDVTSEALTDVANAKRPGSTLNSALLIKTAGIVSGLAVIIIIFKKK